MSSIFMTSTRQGPLSSGLREFGYEISETRIGGKLLIRLISPSGRTWLTGAKASYPMNSHETQAVADDKRLSYLIAESLSISIASTAYVEYGGRGVELVVADMLNSCERLIVKPSDSYKSRGVTLNLTTDVEVQVALEVGFRESSVCIIQEQIEAEEYRFTVIDGSVVSVLRRERPQVVGDGISTLKELIRLENELRIGLSNDFISYPKWTEELVGSTVSSDEILDVDEIRILSRTTMVSMGASVYEVLDQTCDEYVSVAERFASEIAAGFVAIDMFLTDHVTSAPYWFNECNASPALKLYYATRNTDTSGVIGQVLKMTHDHLNYNVKHDIV